MYLNHDHIDFAARFTKLVAARHHVISDVDQEVATIIGAVRNRGDDAVTELTERFDRVSLTPQTMRIKADTIAEAVAEITEDQFLALQQAAHRIEAYHNRQKPTDDWYTDTDGVGLGSRWTAIDAIGIYVPGGTAAYPSSVLMSAIPARVAGVTRIAMVVPTPDGELNPLVLAAAHIAGIDEIYRIGGAQAIAALAFGTPTVTAVDKIVGPGNAYVASAKRQVFGKVGIDMVAGPSEILVVADASNNPTWIATDLMSQAEHDAAAQSVLITDNAAFGYAVDNQIDHLLKALPRGEIARASWQQHGAIIIVGSFNQAPALIDELAPEHVELAIDQPMSLADNIQHAGAIFLGRYTPEAIGDYIAGPSHVLPTARTARFTSGLSVLDFVKRTSLIECDEASINKIGPAAITLAEAEGLDAHARSIAVRIHQTIREKQESNQ